MVNGKQRIMCENCGKLKRQEDFTENRKGRICTECFEPLTETTTDLIKHVKGLYDKGKSVDLDSE
jgi:protein-arginine kinase activator protein McsA